MNLQILIHRTIFHNSNDRIRKTTIRSKQSKTLIIFKINDISYLLIRCLGDNIVYCDG